MLFRAALIYSLAVVIVLLSAAVVWQRAAVSSLSAEAAMAVNTSIDLRGQLDQARNNTAEAEREARLLQQAVDEEMRRRTDAERMATAARAELEHLRGASQTASEVRKTADNDIAGLKKDLESQTQALAAMRTSLATARSDADHAKTELDTLRRQMPVAITGSTRDPATTAAPAPGAANGPVPALTPDALVELENKFPAATPPDATRVAGPNAEPKRPAKAFTGRRSTRRRMPAATQAETQDGLPF